jgi:hypothetical protein
MNFFFENKIYFCDDNTSQLEYARPPRLTYSTSIFQLKHGLSLKLSLRVVSSLKPTPL